MVRTPLSERLYGDDDVRRRREQFVPLGSIGTPQQIADAVLFLAGSKSAYMTGQDILVDGGVGLTLVQSFPNPQP